jgi:SAM-dependent methyltransferase
MDAKTVSHYDNHAGEASARYESADMSRLHAMLLRHLPQKGASVLELGCGSGRDAAFLQASGYDLTAVDASPGMVAEAARIHPELAGRLSCAAVPFPEDSPLLRRSFDAVFSNAMFMHIPDHDLPLVVEQVRRMMRPGGVAIISVSVDRGGLADGRDRTGRLFRERQPDELRKVFERRGLSFVAQSCSADSLDRPAIRWITLVFASPSGNR